MLLCLPSSRFSLASPPTCVFASPPRQIEDGGKAALCKKLKVGDELININGSALYGSRQEALILIKGSYRILKLTVRRWALSSNLNRMHEHTRSYLHIHFHDFKACIWVFVLGKTGCVSHFYRHLTSSRRWLTVVGRKVKQEAGGRSGRLFAWHANTHQDFPDVSQEVTFDLWGVTLKADSDKKRWTGSLELCARFRSKLTLYSRNKMKRDDLFQT